MKTIYTIQHIASVFSRQGDFEIAKDQAAYMKNQFAFFGIKSPQRRDIQRPFLHRENLPSKEEALPGIRQLWAEPQRELQYFAMDLLQKYLGQFEIEDIDLLVFLITHKSWWDTVDFLAASGVGSYLQKFPGERDRWIDRWIGTDNIWLQRTCLLFQLKYKNEVDTGKLKEIIGRLNGSGEFFINKAIGWALREYSKTNPAWVETFVQETALHPLSRREALKVINRGRMEF